MKHSFLKIAFSGQQSAISKGEKINPNFLWLIAER
jgi:hypothetical protein